MLLSVLTSFLASFLSKAVADVWSRWRADLDAQALGRAQAVSEAQAAALDATTAARRLEVETEAAQAADPTDAAFDQTFRRP